jgi:hypothetical protein
MMTILLLLASQQKKIADVDAFDFLIPATRIIEQRLNKNNDLAGLPARELKKRLKADNSIYYSE